MATDDLNGVAGVDYPIKIAGGVWPPWVYPCAEWYPVIDLVKCPYPGISAELLHYAMTAANLKYEIVPWDKIDHGGSWGKLIGYDDQGKPLFDGLIGMVANETFFAIMATYSLSDIRFQSIDYSFPIQSLRMKWGYILGNQGGGVDLSSATLLFGMFHPALWAAFLGTLVLIVILLNLVRSFHKRQHPEEANNRVEQSASWDIFSMVLDCYNGAYSEGYVAGNALMWCGAILSLLLHNYYKAYLITQLLKETTGQPFTGMRDLTPLIKSNKYRFVTYSLSDSYMSHVVNAEGEKYELMREAIEANPPLITHTRGYDKGMDIINEDDKVYYIWPGAKEMNFPAWSVGRCNLIFIPDNDQGNVFVAYIITKGTWQGRRLFEVMAGMVPFMTYLDEKYHKHATRDDICKQNAAHKGPQGLKVRHYDGLMVVGLGGVVAGFLMLLLECILGKIRVERNRIKLVLAKMQLLSYAETETTHC